VYTDRLRTEWKYKRKCTVTANMHSSDNCTDTALGEFFDLQRGFKPQTYNLILTYET